MSSFDWFNDVDATVKEEVDAPNDTLENMSSLDWFDDVDATVKEEVDAPNDTLENMSNFDWFDDVDATPKEEVDAPNDTLENMSSFDWFDDFDATLKATLKEAFDAPIFTPHDTLPLPCTPSQAKNAGEQTKNDKRSGSETVNSRRGDVNITFYDDIDPRFAPESNTIPWHAELVITAKDVVALLEHGFFCSEENIEVGKGSDVPNKPPQQLPDQPSPELAPLYRRRYAVADTSPDRAWEGSFDVYANHPATLNDVRLSNLSPSDIQFATASDSKGRLIYSYDINGYGDNFDDNFSIFGTMPLSGWWPWPKEGAN